MITSIAQMIPADQTAVRRLRDIFWKASSSPKNQFDAVIGLQEFTSLYFDSSERQQQAELILHFLNQNTH